MRNRHTSSFVIIAYLSSVQFTGIKANQIDIDVNTIPKSIQEMIDIIPPRYLQGFFPRVTGYPNPTPTQPGFFFWMPGGQNVSPDEWASHGQILRHGEVSKGDKEFIVEVGPIAMPAKIPWSAESDQAIEGLPVENYSHEFNIIKIPRTNTKYMFEKYAGVALCNDHRPCSTVFSIRCAMFISEGQQPFCDGYVSDREFNISYHILFRSVMPEQIARTIVTSVQLIHQWVQKLR